MASSVVAICFYAQKALQLNHQKELYSADTFHNQIIMPKERS